MVGRNRKFIGHSEWMNEFNKIHNADYYYDKKTKTKKTQTKKIVPNRSQGKSGSGLNKIN